MGLLRDIDGGTVSFSFIKSKQTEEYYIYPIYIETDQKMPSYILDAYTTTNVQKSEKIYYELLYYLNSVCYRLDKVKERQDLKEKLLKILRQNELYDTSQYKKIMKIEREQQNVLKEKSEKKQGKSCKQPKQQQKQQKHAQRGEQKDADEEKEKQAEKKEMEERKKMEKRESERRKVKQEFEDISFYSEVNTPPNTQRSWGTQQTCFMNGSSGEWCLRKGCSTYRSASQHHIQKLDKKHAWYSAI